MERTEVCGRLQFRENDQFFISHPMRTIITDAALPRKEFLALNQVKPKSRNQTFQWLEALAIIMVIDDHVSTRVGILSSVFPYNSFYMPMLVFISGYFFKRQRCRRGDTA